MKRLLSVLLVLMLCLSLLPSGALAETELVEESLGETAGDPVTDSALLPGVEPVVESADEPAEEPMVESTEESVEESANEPVEEPVEESTEESADESTEESVEESVEEPVEETAEDPTQDGAATGKCGANVSYSFDSSSGTMTISGTGAMTSYKAASYTTNVPWYSFRSSIKQVVVSSGVTEVGAYAFADCESLTSLTLADSVSKIGEGAFCECDRLGTATLGSGLTSIGDEAFYDCTSLSSLTIPSGVTDIGFGAFGYSKADKCPCLLAIGNCGASGSETKVKWLMFPSGQLFITGKGAMQDYTSGSPAPWSAYTVTSLTVCSGVTGIGAYAFSACEDLTDVYVDSLKQWSSVKTGNDPLLKVKTLHCTSTAGATPLTFTAEQHNSTVTLNYSYTPTVRYSRDGGTTWNVYTKGDPILLGSVGNAVSLIGTKVETYSGAHFSMTGKIAASGDVTSLTNGYGGAVELSNIDDTNCYSYMFDGCSELTSAPNLPSTVLANSCYDCMFRGCTGLTAAPNLPATNLASCCYSYMFYGCTGLKTAPARLPATTLANRCYSHMFEGCTGLTAAPELPATTLADACYSSMFANCTALTTAPDLPATALKGSCYSEMFSNCAALTAAPELPAATMESHCYQSMFAFCSRLTEAPELPATTLADYCYSNMFYGCSGIRLYKADTGSGKTWSIPAGATEATSWNLTMFGGTAGGDIEDNPEIGKTYYYADATYLTFTAQLANSTVTFQYKSGTDVQYSQNNGTWTACPSGTTITLAGVGDTVRFRGENVVTGKNAHFSMTGKLAASGDVTSLTNRIGGEVDLLITYCYEHMFSGCTALAAAPSLPSKILSKACYSCMFDGCTGLTAAPALPATILAEECYFAMFRGCTELRAAPTLSAGTMKTGCYSYMFRGCVNLEKAPDLPTKNQLLAESCYEAMFQGCTALASAPVLPATTLAKNCYKSMFYECKALTVAPALPATTLAEGCYQNMFAWCTALTSAPALPATTMAKNCYDYMFVQCGKLTKAPALPATTLAENCYCGMFSDTGIKLYPTDGGNSETWGIPAEAVAATDWNKNMFANTGSTIGTAPAIGTTYYYAGRTASYLTFTAEQANSTITFQYSDGTNVQYAQNGGTWTACPSGTTITLAKVGDTVKFKGTGVETSYDKHFSMTGKLAASGDVTSLTNGIGGDAALTDYCYVRMFDGCTALTAVPKLPSTVMKSFCYFAMFQGCAGLTEAPALPAMTLAVECYQDMFSGCTGLTKAPVLPATVMASACYEYMFNGCTGLTEAPALPAKVMVRECYYGMFCGCKGLTKAPVLPATALAEKCYYHMFYGCSGICLNKANTGSGKNWSLPADAVTTGAASWNEEMFTNTGGDIDASPNVGVPYYYPNTMFGDVNGDGCCNIMDLILLMKYIIGDPAAVADAKYPDVNGSGGTPDLLDLVSILKYLVK